MREAAKGSGHRSPVRRRQPGRTPCSTGIRRCDPRSRRSRLVPVLEPLEAGATAPMSSKASRSAVSRSRPASNSMIAARSSHASCHSCGQRFSSAFHAASWGMLPDRDVGRGGSFAGPAVLHVDPPAGSETSPKPREPGKLVGEWPWLGFPGFSVPRVLHHAGDRGLGRLRPAGSRSRCASWGIWFNRAPGTGFLLQASAEGLVVFHAASPKSLGLTWTTVFGRPPWGLDGLFSRRTQFNASSRSTAISTSADVPRSVQPRCATW